MIDKYSGSSSALANGYQKISLQITPDQSKYQYQTVTVENRTLKLRWSVDVPYNGSKQLAGIIAGPNDDLYVMVNRTTYAVVALFGFGIGVYDINAIESNDHPIDSAAIYRDKKPAKLVALTSGKDEDVFDPTSVISCDQASQASSGLPCAIECSGLRSRSASRPLRWQPHAAHHGRCLAPRPQRCRWGGAVAHQSLSGWPGSRFVRSAAVVRKNSTCSHFC